MSNIKNWSKTPASNNSSPPNGAPENMAPSTVNNIMRQQMADHRTQWEDAEWFDWGHVPVYASGTSFVVSISSSVGALIYTAGRRLKLNDAATIGAEVLAASASGSNTLITISGSAISSSLSSLSISILDPSIVSLPYTSDTGSGVVELATTAETATGTDSTRAITPAGMAGNVTLSSVGSLALPGGYLAQWGTGTGTQNVTFATAYTAVYGIYTGHLSGTSGATARITSVATTGCQIVVDGGGAATTYWLVIGKV